MKLTELIGLLGRDATAKLIERFGGLRIYVKMRPDDEYVALLGAQPAARLSRAMGGQFLVVPTRLPVSTSEIADMRRQGLSLNEIALHTKRSRSAILAALQHARSAS